MSTEYTAEYKGGTVDHLTEFGDKRPHITERWQVEHSLQLISLSLSELRKISQALSAHICAGQSSDQTAILTAIAQLKENIMSAISDFASRQNAFNDRQDAAITALTADVAALNAKIEELQNTPGVITPEDQALLDAIETRSDAIAAKLEALDALTPPAPPVA